MSFVVHLAWLGKKTRSYGSGSDGLPALDLYLNLLNLSGKLLYLALLRSQVYLRIGNQVFKIAHFALEEIL